MLARIFGANYKTTLTTIGAALFAALTFLSGLSYDLGPLALWIDPEWKPVITKWAGLATLVLWIWNGIQQKSKDVTGGSVAQDETGAIARPQPHIPDPPQPAVPALRPLDKLRVGVVLLLPCFLLSACSTTDTDTRIDLSYRTKDGAQYGVGLSRSERAALRGFQK